MITSVTEAAPKRRSGDTVFALREGLSALTAESAFGTVDDYRSEDAVPKLNEALDENGEDVGSGAQGAEGDRETIHTGTIGAFVRCQNE